MNRSGPNPGFARLAAAAIALTVAGCGGGSSSSSNPPPTPPPTYDLVRVSGTSPFAGNCGGGLPGSVLYENAEVEPYIAINPTNPLDMVGIWQQDRWSDGGAHGLVVGTSFDGGATWSRQPLPVSSCAGGSYARASDPWATFGPTGVAYAISLSFTGVTFQPGSSSAMLVSRSADGGATWSDPVTLIADGSTVLNDKESITADPNDAAYVYAVWDRLTTTQTGPTYFARTADGGTSWESAQPIYDPGTNNQTLGNVAAVLPDGTLVVLLTEIDNAFTGTPSAALKLIRSTDHGATWSAPTKIADDLAIGTFDPETGRAVRSGADLGAIAVGPGGTLYVAWQDARFSGGRRDGIAFTQSGDGGQNWTAPVEINGDPAVQAFTPAIAVSSDGTIGVTYYDFRANTVDPSTLPADAWLTVSNDGLNWNEQQIAGPFDLDFAPDAEGLFLGDYEGLATAGSDFVPFFVQTENNRGDPTNVYVRPPASSSSGNGARVTAHPAPATPALSAAFRRRVQGNLVRLLEEEIPARAPAPVAGGRPAPD